LYLGIGGGRESARASHFAQVGSELQNCGMKIAKVRPWPIFGLRLEAAATGLHNRVECTPGLGKLQLAIGQSLRLSKTHRAGDCFPASRAVLLIDFAPAQIDTLTTALEG
jgi:hypothetical protein